jgi:hypothetical protein
LIPVIASFGAFFNAVAAVRNLTKAGAHIRVAGVTVVALFATLPVSIAARSVLASVGAGVGVEFVAIIALFTSVLYTVATLWRRCRNGLGCGFWLDDWFWLGRFRLDNDFWLWIRFGLWSRCLEAFLTHGVNQGKALHCNETNCLVCCGACLTHSLAETFCEIL